MALPTRQSGSGCLQDPPRQSSGFRQGVAAAVLEVGRLVGSDQVHDAISLSCLPLPRTLLREATLNVQVVMGARLALREARLSERHQRMDAPAPTDLQDTALSPTASRREPGLEPTCFKCAICGGSAGNVRAMSQAIL